MVTPDVYYDAALACITLICDECDANLDSEDLPEGQPRFKDSGYYLALGDEAFRRGWRIEYRDDFQVLCPECAKMSKSDEGDRGR
jgi:hypothetical protein